MSGRKLRGVAITVCVVAFWAIMMGLLVKGEIFVRRLESPQSSSAENGGWGPRPVDSWMGIYLSDGTKVGYTHYTLQPRGESAGGGYRGQNVTRIKMSPLGRPVEIRAKWHLDAGGKLENLTFNLNSRDWRFAVEGNVENETLMVKVHAGEDEFTTELPINDNLLVSSALNPVMGLPDLEEGVEYTVAVPNPVSRTTHDVKVRASALQTVELSESAVVARRIEVDFDGLVTIVWVAEDGGIVKVEMPIGLVIIKESPERARRGVEFGWDLPEMPSAVADRATNTDSRNGISLSPELPEPDVRIEADRNVYPTSFPEGGAGGLP